MTTHFENSFDAGMQEHAVVSACYDLGWAMQDKDFRAVLANPKSIRDLKKAREQLDSVIRKLEIGKVISPVIEGACREVRQAEILT